MKTKQLCGIPWKVSKPKPQIATLPWKKTQKSPATRITPLDENKRRNIEKGKDAEILAKEFLLNKGLTLVDQNYRAKCGELDLIMANTKIAVIVEVRYRQSISHGGAAESVDSHKRRKIIRCASLWWQAQGQFKFDGLRFDVLAIDKDKKIQWIQSAFSLNSG